MRTLWLVDPNTNERWNLSSMNPNSILGGCMTSSLSGFGVSTSIEKVQVGVDYIVSEVSSKSKNIKFTMYFRNYNHLKAFIKFYKSRKNELELHYDPTGQIKYSDTISASWYRKILFNDIDLTGEKNTDGFIHVIVSLEVLSDVWYKNISIKTNSIDSVSNPLTYPKFYNYFYDGQQRLALQISNEGIEVGCKIKVINSSQNPVSNIEWLLINEKIDANDNIEEETQKAKFNVLLNTSYSIEVDSTPIKQSAFAYFQNQKINVVHYQEPDYDYINFIQLPSGNSKLIFLLDTTSIDVEVSYTLATEIAY